MKVGWLIRNKVQLSRPIDNVWLVIAYAPWTSDYRGQRSGMSVWHVLGGETGRIHFILDHELDNFERVV